MVKNLGPAVPGRVENRGDHAEPGTPGTDSDPVTPGDPMTLEDLLPEAELTDHPVAEDPFRDWALFLSEAYADR